MSNNPSAASNDDPGKSHQEFPKRKFVQLRPHFMVPEPPINMHSTPPRPVWYAPMNHQYMPNGQPTQTPIMPMHPAPATFQYAPNGQPSQAPMQMQTHPAPVVNQHISNGQPHMHMPFQHSWNMASQDPVSWQAHVPGQVPVPPRAQWNTSGSHQPNGFPQGPEAHVHGQVLVSSQTQWNTGGSHQPNGFPQGPQAHVLEQVSDPRRAQWNTGGTHHSPGFSGGSNPSPWPQQPNQVNANRHPQHVLRGNHGRRRTSNGPTSNESNRYSVWSPDVHHPIGMWEGSPDKNQQCKEYTRSVAKKKSQK